MSAAYTIPNAACDPFAPTHEQAVMMERHLRSADAMEATHGALEEYIRREGREYERRLLQGNPSARGV